MHDNDFEEDGETLEQQKQERAAKRVYVILAVLIAATMIISVITAINRRRAKPAPDPAPSDSETGAAVTDKTKPAETRPRYELIDPIPDTPVTGPAPAADPVTEPAKTEPEPEETGPEEPASVERIYAVPVSGNVLKDYTMDLPVYSITMNDYRVHNGVDIAAPVGSEVFAFCDGVIEKIYYDPMMGQTVVIDHGEGLKSRYQNLQITLPDGIEEGVKVSAGDVIGAVGETALVECAEVPHLHFTVLLDGKCAPPADYIGSIDHTYDE